MEVSKHLKKQIVIEVLALIFLVAVIIYAMFAINRGNNSKVTNVDGMVFVVDNYKNKAKLEASSDGVGVETKGVNCTVTNNNTDLKEYKILLVPNTKDEKILSQVRVSTDDMYIESLTDLEKDNNGYVVTTHKLAAGYTKVHLVKLWYKLGTDKDVLSKDISFTYKLVTE